MDGQRESSVTAYGVGRVSVVPDAASVDVTLEVTDPSPSAAYARVNAVARQVVDVLDTQGVAPADRRTQRVSLRPHWEQIPGTMSSSFAGYVATIALWVRIRRLDAVPDLLDAMVATAGEALRLGGFALIGSDVDEARSRAETAAVADARDRAGRLAEAAGATLGPVIAIRHDTAPGSQGHHMVEQSMGAAVQPGEDPLAVRVVAVFGLTA